MNPLKKGPEIKLPDKMPEIKVPKFLADLYADLRDRHLLPLVAVLAVAIVAVPIALSESGSEEEVPAGGATAPVGRTSGASAGTRNVVVARSTPGLRSYHKRLSHLTATDPFKQKYVDSPPKENNTSSGENGSSETGGSSSSEGGATVTTEEGQTITETQEIKFFTYEIDVRVVPVSTNGVPSKAEPSVRRGLPELTQLPGRDTPALVFMQPTADGKKALMLINSNVKAIFGEGVCAAGGETCLLLALKPGLPETIVYGGNERIFRIELLKIDLIETDHLTKAPLGKPNKGS